MEIIGQNVTIFANIKYLQILCETLLYIDMYSCSVYIHLQWKLLDRMLQSLQTLKIYKSCVKRCFISTCMHVSVNQIICDVNCWIERYILCRH